MKHKLLATAFFAEYVLLDTRKMMPGGSNRSRPWLGLALGGVDLRRNSRR